MSSEADPSRRAAVNPQRSMMAATAGRELESSHIAPLRLGSDVTVATLAS